MTSNHEQRRELNDLSRSYAVHHAEPWTAEEVEQLEGFWDGTDETLAEIAELLGRTVEACRQRHYYPQGEGRPRTPVHATGWLIGFCSDCGRFTDVWCNGLSNQCDECKTPTEEE